MLQVAELLREGELRFALDPGSEVDWNLDDTLDPALAHQLQADLVADGGQALGSLVRESVECEEARHGV